MNIENELNESIAREKLEESLGAADHPEYKLPEYLDSLAQSLSVDGKPHCASDIRGAADEIRKLTQKVDQLAAGMAEVASREDQLASALFSLIEDRVQTFVENEVQTAIDDYDPTDHHNFSDAVAEQTADTPTEAIREAVAEVIKNGYFDVTFSS